MQPSDPDARRAAAAQAYREAGAPAGTAARPGNSAASTIIERAREAGLFAHDSPQLVGLLARSDLDRHVPPALYAAAAHVLVWVRRLEDREP